MKHGITKGILAALAAGLSGITAAQAQVSCGAVITNKQVMTADLFCVLNNPVVTIDGGELDMNGHTIGCLPGQDGVGMINSGGKLRNGSIEGCDRGVVLAGTGKHTVTNITAKGGNDVGFFILGSGNKLIQNTASGFANEGFHAATALPPLKDKFVDNIAANNGGYGFEIYGDKAVLTGNIAVGNGLSGISIDGEDNKLTRNTAYDNGGFGIFVIGARSYVTLNNSIGNQDYGLAVLSNESKVKSNLTLSNGASGYVANAADSIHSRNVSVLNTDDGIAVSSLRFQVTKNVAVLNGGDGIRLPAGADALAQRNRSTGNGGKGLLVETTTTVIKGNHAYDNATDADDVSATCATNVWTDNVFGVTADACIE